MNGQATSTGRWLLLRHSHFLLRASHTIAWVDNPEYNPAHPALHPEHSDFAACAGKQFRETVGVVWDWKSSTERWRWAMWLAGGGGPTAGLEPIVSVFTANNLDVQLQNSAQTIDWAERSDDGIAVGESISAVDRDIKDISLT